MAKFSTPSDSHKSWFERKPILNRANEVAAEATLPVINVSLIDIDTAFHRFLLDSVSKGTIVESGKFIDIPVEFANAEKWVDAQRNSYIRDSQGKVMTPLILLQRDEVAIRQELAKLRYLLDSEENARIFKRKYTPRNRYDKHTRLNDQIPTEEYYVVRTPDYVTINYQVIIWTEKQEQLNSVIERLIHLQGGTIGETYKFTMASLSSIRTEISNTQQQDRFVKAEVTIQVHAYLLPKDDGIDPTTYTRFTTTKVEFGTERLDGELVNPKHVIAASKRTTFVRITNTDQTVTNIFPNNDFACIVPVVNVSYFSGSIVDSYIASSSILNITGRDAAPVRIFDRYGSGSITRFAGATFSASRVSIWDKYGSGSGYLGRSGWSSSRASSSSAWDRYNGSTSTTLGSGASIPIAPGGTFSASRAPSASIYDRYGNPNTRYVSPGTSFTSSLAPEQTGSIIFLSSPSSSAWAYWIRSSTPIYASATASSNLIASTFYVLPPKGGNFPSPSTIPFAVPRLYTFFVKLSKSVAGSPASLTVNFRGMTGSQYVPVPVTEPVIWNTLYPRTSGSKDAFIAPGFGGIDNPTVLLSRDTANNAASNTIAATSKQLLLNSASRGGVTMTNNGNDSWMGLHTRSISVTNPAGNYITWTQQHHHIIDAAYLQTAYIYENLSATSVQTYNGGGLYPNNKWRFEATGSVLKYFQISAATNTKTLIRTCPFAFGYRWVVTFWGLAQGNAVSPTFEFDGDWKDR